MNENEQAAFIMSQVACAQIEAEGMTAENMQRQALGQSMAFVQEDFVKLITTYRIGYNDVLEYLRR